MLLRLCLLPLRRKGSVYCFFHAFPVVAVPPLGSWTEPIYSIRGAEASLLQSCLLKNQTAPHLRPQSPFVQFVRLQESLFSVHGSCTISSLHSFTFKLCHSCLRNRGSHCFLYPFSTVLLLHSCTLESFITSFLLVQARHPFFHYQGFHRLIHSRFLHLPTFWNLMDILLASFMPI